MYQDTIHTACTRTYWYRQSSCVIHEITTQATVDSGLTTESSLRFTCYSTSDSFFLRYVYSIAHTVPRTNLPCCTRRKKVSFLYIYRFPQNHIVQKSRLNSWLHIIYMYGTM